MSFTNHGWGAARPFRAIYPIVGFSSLRTDYARIIQLNLLLLKVIRFTISNMKVLKHRLIFSHSLFKSFLIPQSDQPVISVELFFNVSGLSFFMGFDEVKKYTRKYEKKIETEYLEIRRQKKAMFIARFGLEKYRRRKSKSIRLVGRAWAARYIGINRRLKRRLIRFFNPALRVKKKRGKVSKKKVRSRFKVMNRNRKSLYSYSPVGLNTQRHRISSWWFWNRVRKSEVPDYRVIRSLERPLFKKPARRFKKSRFFRKYKRYFRNFPIFARLERRLFVKKFISRPCQTKFRRNLKFLSRLKRLFSHKRVINFDCLLRSFLKLFDLDLNLNIFVLARLINLQSSSVEFYIYYFTRTFLKRKQVSPKTVLKHFTQFMFRNHQSLNLKGAKIVVSGRFSKQVRAKPMKAHFGKVPPNSNCSRIAHAHKQFNMRFGIATLRLFVNYAR